MSPKDVHQVSSVKIASNHFRLNSRTDIVHLYSFKYLVFYDYLTQFNDICLDVEQDYTMKKDWQQYGTSATDLNTTMPNFSYRAKELTKRGKNSHLNRKVSMDNAHDFFTRNFTKASVPPIAADLAKAAENTKNFMTEISFLKDTSRNSFSNSFSNMNMNSNFKTCAPSTVNSPRNNLPMGNGIHSKGLNNVTGSSSMNNKNGNGNFLRNSNVNGEDYPGTVDVGTTINSRKKSSHADSNTVLNRTNGGDLDMNNSDRSQLTNSDPISYPSIGQGKRSQSQQIIATPHQPCCECLGCRGDYRDSMGDVSTGDTNKGAPICVLFAIFLLVSIVVISCVMVYLKAGRVNVLWPDNVLMLMSLSSFDLSKF